MWSDGQMVRRVGVIAGAVAVVLMLAGCIASPPLGDGRSQRLPLGIPALLVSSCEQSVGLGGSAPVTAIWRDAQGLHVRIGPASKQIAGAPQSATELALLSCLTVASSRLPSYPRDSGQLLLLWKYSATVLWPCFRRHGIDVGPTPSRADFLGGDPLKLDPYYVARASMTELQYLQSQRDCPAIPDYLATPTPTPTPAGG
jgi:hypothetical protein